MAKNWLMGLFTLAVLALALGMLVPGLMAATTEDAQQTLKLYENDSAELTDELTIELREVNATSENATYALIDGRDYTEISGEINTTSSRTFTLSGDNITVTTGEIVANESVLTTAQYPGMFGWSDGPRLFMEHIGLIIVLIVGSMLLLIVGKGVQR